MKSQFRIIFFFVIYIISSITFKYSLEKFSDPTPTNLRGSFLKNSNFYLLHNKYSGYSFFTLIKPFKNIFKFLNSSMSLLEQFFL